MKSKRSLTKAVATQQKALSSPERQSAGESSAHGEIVLASGGPANRGEGQSERVPRQGAGVHPSGDDPTGYEVLPPLSHYKGTSLANIGRDKNGRVIPHKRSEKTALQVARWATGGYTKNDIAIALNIRPGLVEECYGKELRHGKDFVGMDMTAHVIKRAKHNDNMARFVLKSQFGWRDGESKPLDTGLLNIHIHT